MSDAQPTSAPQVTSDPQAATGPQAANVSQASSAPQVTGDPRLKIVKLNDDFAVAVNLTRHLGYFGDKGDASGQPIRQEPVASQLQTEHNSVARKMADTIPEEFTANRFKVHTQGAPHLEGQTLWSLRNRGETNHGQVIVAPLDAPEQRAVIAWGTKNPIGMTVTAGQESQGGAQAQAYPVNVRAVKFDDRYVVTVPTRRLGIFQGTTKVNVPVAVFEALYSKNTPAVPAPAP